MKKNVNKLSVILDGICAVIWIFMAVYDAINKYWISDPVKFGMDIFCAVTWTVCFFIWLNLYKKAEKDEQ